MSQPACIFLPGIVLPAAFRYPPLFAALGPTGMELKTKELEVYATETPADDFSISDEVQALDRFAATNAGERFHLYGHSGGGAVCLAFTAAYPERVLSLALDEPASDFSAEDQADPYWTAIDRVRALPPDQAVPAFLAAQLAPGVPLPPPPPGPPPPWMAKRPRGIAAFAEAVREHQVPLDRYRAFGRPVLFTYGSLTNPRWDRMRERLAGTFPRFQSERFEGLHHLNTSHQAEPARVAVLLRSLWKASDS
ncbi:MAG: hypothetical protein NVSMB8_06250 [Candidatus Limnocylindrales bacterium]